MKSPDDPGDPSASDDPDHPVLLNDEAQRNHPEVSLLNLQRAYDFRDNFLSQTVLGKKYIRYHYKIAEYPNETSIIQSNFTQCYDFALDLYEIADILENGSDSTIVFDNTFRQNALGMLNLYRSEPNLNSEIRIVLDSIELDLSRFVNKPRGYIISFSGN